MQNGCIYGNQVLSQVHYINDLISFYNYSHSNVTKYDLNYWYYSVLKLILFVLSGEMAGRYFYKIPVGITVISTFINGW